MTAALDPTLAVASMQTNLMKFIRFIAIFVLASCLNLPAHAELADGVKAVVNDAVITYSQVEEFTAPAAEALRRQYPDAPDTFQLKLNDALGDSLEQLVERQLILRSFEVDGYQPAGKRGGRAGAGPASANVSATASPSSKHCRRRE